MHNNARQAIAELSEQLFDRLTKLQQQQERTQRQLQYFIKMTELHRLSQVMDIDVSASINDKFIEDGKLVDIVFEIEKNRRSEMFKQIRRFHIKSDAAREEQAFPTDAGNLFNESYRKMLRRYIFAGKLFCENKIVLDSCSGFGWGTYIISHYAKAVVAYDRDARIIDECREHYIADNITWMHSDALDPKLPEGEQFDTILAMEAIEHFTRDEGAHYIQLHHAKLKKGGFFVGSSLFPQTRAEAETSPVLAMAGHKYLWAKDELIGFLRESFSSVRMVGNWIFIAQK